MPKLRYILILFLLFKNNLLYSQCGKVISVHDGDTFKMLMGNEETLKVRVAYVDAPEYQQDFGKKAQRFTEKLILEKKVCLDILYKDPYGRSVALVKLENGKILNEELLKNGMAWHYTQYSKSKDLQHMEDRARTNSIGIWSHAQPMAPWKWREAERTIKRRHH
jgi:endonuclease YncB( thermonuclease family)